MKVIALLSLIFFVPLLSTIAIITGEPSIERTSTRTYIFIGVQEEKEVIRGSIENRFRFVFVSSERRFYYYRSWTL